jgi:hypothetical protein
MRLNSSRQITPDFVSVGILNAIPSGLLSQSRSSVICSWEIPCCLRIIIARVNGCWISGSLVAFHRVCSAQWLNNSGNSWASSVQTVRKLFSLLIQIKRLRRCAEYGLESELEDLTLWWTFPAISTTFYTTRDTVRLFVSLKGSEWRDEKFANVMGECVI